MDPHSAGSLAPPPPAPILELREATALNIAAQKRAGAAETVDSVGAQFSVVALGTGKAAPDPGGQVASAAPVAPAAPATGFVAALSAKFTGGGKTGSAGAGTGSAAPETVAEFL